MGQYNLQHLLPSKGVIRVDHVFYSLAHQCQWKYKDSTLSSDHYLISIDFSIYRNISHTGEDSSLIRFYLKYLDDIANIFLLADLYEYTSPFIASMLQKAHQLLP